jgi:hypothetical protein
MVPPNKTSCLIEKTISTRHKFFTEPQKDVSSAKKMIILVYPNGDRRLRPPFSVCER